LEIVLNNTTNSTADIAVEFVVFIANTMMGGIFNEN